jgi:hypothetical protein
LQFNKKDEYVPSLAVAKGILAQTIHSADLSDLIVLVGPEILGLIEEKINDADSDKQEDAVGKIFKALECLKDFVSDDLLSDSQLNEDDLITKEQIEEAIEKCVSDDFKAALANAVKKN